MALRHRHEWAIWPGPLQRWPPIKLFSFADNKWMAASYYRLLINFLSITHKLFYISLCAAKALFYCPSMNSHRPRSQNTSKGRTLNPEKDSSRKRPRLHVSLEKSSKNYKPLENWAKPNLLPDVTPQPANYFGDCFRRVCHVVKPEPREFLAILISQINWPREGERAGWIAVCSSLLSGLQKPAQFGTRIVSDVLLLSYLDKIGLSLMVEAGQALAVLYSKARLYKGPSLAGLSQSTTTTRSTGNISVWIQKVGHSNTRGTVSSLFFSRSK